MTSKRQPKVAQVKPEEGFVDGSIVRVEVKDFLTYSGCVFKFGPGLNVLLGPNGTGKSSVVCAICLGLAGPQNLLGRAREIGDFVRHGQEEAWIIVEVFRRAGNITFTRHIKRENNVSQWKINGQQASLKKAQEEVSKLNIQLDNLCQFLPQDRVVDFARLTPPELLKATEKAVGNTSMYSDHDKLIDLRRREKELEVKASRNSDELERLKHQNSLVDRDVQRYQERRQFMLKVTDLENKKPWVEYEEIRTEFSEANQRTKDAKAELEQLRSAHAPMKSKLDEAKRRHTDYEKESRDLAKFTNEAASKCRRIIDQLGELEDETSQPAQQMEQARREEAERQQKVTTAEQTVEQLQSDMVDLVPADQLKPQLQEVTGRLREVNNRVLRLQQDQSRLRDEQEPQAREVQSIEGELKRLEDVSNRRFLELRQRDRDTFNAVQWLRNNQDQFKQHVYEPVLLVVNMKKTEDARYFEGVVGFNTLITFVCQNEDDLMLFCKLVRDNQNLRINAAAVPSTPMEEFRRRDAALANVKRQFDFRSSLLELIEGPEPVLRYLCERNQLYSTLVGTDHTESNIDRVINGSELRMFCTPKSLYAVKKSRYSDNKSTQVNDIKPGRFLNVAVDTQRCEENNRRLLEIRSAMENGRQRIERLRDEERQLRMDSSGLKKQKDELQAQKEKRGSLENQLSLARKRLQRYVTNTIDLVAVDAEVKKRLKELNLQRAQCATELANLVKKLVNCSKEKIAIDMKALQQLMIQDQLESEFREANTTLIQAQEAIEDLEKRSRDLKQAAKEKHRMAKQKLNISENKPSAEMIAVFNTYPSTIAEIDDMIHDLKARAELNYHTDPKIVEEYEKRKTEIERMEASLDGEKDGLGSLSADIAQIKDRWLGPLKALIAQINVKYSEFFRVLGCNGEVELEENDDYDKYCIRILVKFHATQKLHVLTAQHQSGGERSVATMLYLMALQELTTCPFRVVDEINQGMDPNNERRVFEFVVATACRPGTSQYFLITPKLLTNLNYTANMKVHCIYSGVNINDPPQIGFDGRQLVKRMRRQAEHG